MVKIKKTDLSSVKKTEAYKWALSVAMGNTPNKQCELIKLFAERFLNDLKRDDLFFDLSEYEKLVRYYGMFRHTKGLLVGKPFKLRADQQAFLGQVRAWKYRETGEYRITETYKEVARKNGKSWEAGGLAGMALTAWGESEGEIYSLATSEKQAQESWKAFKSMSKTTDNYKKGLQYRLDAVRHPKSNSFFEPVPSTGDLLDGKNPFFILVDEYHLYKPIHDYSLTSLKGGAVARDYTLVFKITTAGNNAQGSCYEERMRAEAILHGTIKADNLLPQVFTLDKGDDWQDENNWYKANPALGISKSIRLMREAYEEAIIKPRLLNAFKNKQLDLWTYGAEESWLNVEKWISCENKKITYESLKGKKCFIGMDLSDTKDLTSLNLYFPIQDGLRKPFTIPFFYVPAVSAVVRETQDKVPYLGWSEQGFIKLVDTGYVDKKMISKQILQFCQDFQVLAVGYDKWHASGIIEELKEANVKTFNVVQGVFLSPACRDLEEEIAEGKIEHNGNKCMQWNIGNIVVETDDKMNIKPNKKKSTERIDGAIAMLVAKSTQIEFEKTNKIIKSCPVRFI